MKLLNSIVGYIRSKSLVRLITTGVLSIVVFTVLLIISYSVISAYRQYKSDAEKLRNELTGKYKILVKEQVQNAIDYIDYNRSLSQERVKLDLKQRVDEAWEIAGNIYNENRSSRSVAEIQKMIKDALRPVRFNNGRGEIFIYTTGGVSVMLPRSKPFENKLSLGLHDSLGNYVVKNEVELMKQVNQGYLSYYSHPDQEGEDSTVFKYTYIRKFEPFNWYFGSKDFIEDYEDDLKDILIQWISNIRYGKDGYIFINTFDGHALLTNGVISEFPVNILKSGDENWINVLQQQKKAVEGGSGFIEYSFNRLSSRDVEPKISYIGQIRDWGWIIGAGFYKSDIEAEISMNLIKLQENTRDQIIRLVVLLAIIILLTILVSGYIFRVLKKEFSRFTDSFKLASLETGLMDKEQISFYEFRLLSDSVNKTLQERNFAQQALEKEQSLLRSLIDSIPDFVFFKDTQSRYVGCNKAFSAFLGIPESEITGRTDYDLFPAEFAERYHENDHKILHDQNPIRTEEWTTFPNGSKRLLDTVKVLYKNQRGEVLGIMAISRDITEKEEIQQQFRIAKEKAEESDRLKTAFLANMSHEIRTPMNSIIGFSTLLTEEFVTDTDRAEYIQHINQAGESLLNLIDDIIDIAKIEAGQLTVTAENCNLTELMDELKTTFTELIHRRFKTEVLLIAEPASLTQGNLIISDPFRLKQVLTNLLVNAMKFTSKGSITFGFRQEEDILRFYVRDTGIGIAKEYHSMIFNRFRQAQHENKKQYGGTGLGLAISQHIIELLGGRIWVESEPGMGADFYFTIPYKPADKTPRPANYKAKDNILLYDWSARTLLVIDELDSGFNFISAALSRTGIRILRAHHIEEGVTMVRNTPGLDMVIAEVSKEGEDLRAHIREMKKLKEGLVVVLQVSDNSAEGMSVLNDCGCDNHLLKPLKFNKLMNLLSEYFDQ